MSAANKAQLDKNTTSIGDISKTLDKINDTVTGYENAIIPFNTCGELEDLTIRVGSFNNAGAGWNTFAFPEPFDGIPIVMCQCDGYMVESFLTTEACIA